MGGELSPDGDLSSRLKSGIPLGCSRFVRDGCGGVAVAQPLANYCDAAGILKRKRPVSKFHRSSQMELSSNSNQLSVHTFDCLGVDATNRTLFVDALRRQGFERVEQPSRSEPRFQCRRIPFRGCLISAAISERLSNVDGGIRFRSSSFCGLTIKVTRASSPRVDRVVRRFYCLSSGFGNETMRSTLAFGL